MKSVLLLAYGSPDKLSDVPEYLGHIYEGRPVPDYAMKENTEKYAMHGGRSPSNEIIRSIALKLQHALPETFTVHLGFKHWHPFIGEVLSDVKNEGPDEIIAIPLFPFPSNNVEKSYIDPLKESLDHYGINSPLRTINGFDVGSLSKIWASIIGKPEFDPSDYALTFDAHSLPTFRGQENEYDASFKKMASEIASILGIPEFFTGYQSIGKYGSSWLRPSLYDILPDIQRKGYSGVFAVPIGFIYEHLEVLYDLDYEFGGYVKEKGLKYARSSLINDNDRFIEFLSSLILRKYNDQA
ncbi:MAG: ferrochelatase [Thermoplasmataceae archaeon]